MTSSSFFCSSLNLSPRSCASEPSSDADARWCWSWQVSSLACAAAVLPAWTNASTSAMHVLPCFACIASRLTYWSMTSSGMPCWCFSSSTYVRSSARISRSISSRSRGSFVRAYWASRSASRFWCATISSVRSSRPSTRSRSSQSASEIVSSSSSATSFGSITPNVPLFAFGAPFGTNFCSISVSDWTSRSSRSQIVARRDVVARTDEPAGEVLQDLLRDHLLAVQRLLVPLARRDHSEAELLRLAEVRATDVVVVLGLDPVADLATRQDQDHNKDPSQLPLCARVRPGDRDRLLAAI